MCLEASSRTTWQSKAKMRLSACMCEQQLGKFRRLLSLSWQSFVSFSFIAHATRLNEKYAEYRILLSQLSAVYEIDFYKFLTQVSGEDLSGTFSSSRMNTLAKMQQDHRRRNMSEGSCVHPTETQWVPQESCVSLAENRMVDSVAW